MALHKNKTNASDLDLGDDSFVLLSNEWDSVR